MLNNISIMGRLCAAPEVKKTNNGTSVCSFAIACERFAKKGEDKKTDFLDVVAWSGTAEFVAKWFKKGDPIIITGSLQSRVWEDENGNKRKSVEIVAAEVNFAGGKRDDGGSSANNTTGFAPGGWGNGGGYAAPVDFPEFPGDFRELSDDDGGLPF